MPLPSNVNLERLSPLHSAEEIPVALYDQWIDATVASPKGVGTFALHSMLSERAFASGDDAHLEEAKDSYDLATESGSEDTNFLTYQACFPLYDARTERRAATTAEVDQTEQHLFDLIRSTREYYQYGAENIQRDNPHLSINQVKHWLHRLSDASTQTVVLLLGIHNYRLGRTNLLLPSSIRERQPPTAVRAVVGNVQHDVHGYDPATQSRQEMFTTGDKDKKRAVLPHYNLRAMAQVSISGATGVQSRGPLDAIDIINILEAARDNPSRKSIEDQIRNGMAKRLAAVCKQSLAKPTTA